MKLFWPENTEKNKENNGFTLVEVIVSIALLATLSVVLLQMFTVSSRTNRSAYELDTANAICVKAAEVYKGDPRDGADSGTYLVSPEFTPTVIGSEITYTKDIDSRFRLEIKSTKGSTTQMPISYYPAPAYEYEIPDWSNIDLILEWDSINSDIDIVIAGSPGDIDSNIIFSEPGMTKTAVIPIHLDCSNNTQDNVFINVDNRIGLLPDGSDLYQAIADIYLCDINEGKEVDVVPVAGMSTENEISKKVQRITKYSGVIRVIRISDGAVLAQNTVEEYWVGN